MRNVYSQFLFVAQNRLALKLSNNNIWKSQYRSGVEQENKNSSNDNLGSTAHFPFPHFCFHLIFFRYSTWFEIFQKQNDIWHKFRAKVQKSFSENKAWDSRSSFFIFLQSVLCRRPWRGGHKHEGSQKHEKFIDYGPCWCSLKKRCSLSQRGNSQKNSSRSLRNNPSKQRGFKCANRRCWKPANHSRTRCSMRWPVTSFKTVCCLALKPLELS